ncbi:MAG: glycoside hydrolase family 18 protein [Candidatus Flexifilum sp.]|jgi:chitinase
MISFQRILFRLICAGGLAALLSAAALPNAAQPDERPYRVIGYFAGWSVYDRAYFVTDIPAEHLTHINYAFANYTPDGEVIAGDPWADMQMPYPGETEQGDERGNFNQLRLLKARHPHLRTLISIGGWTWSQFFSPVAADPERRQRFAASAVEFMRRHGFDGVDIDWEYPGAPGHPLNRRSPDDPENFILLLAALRERLAAQGAQDGRQYLLTIAAGAGDQAIAAVDWARVAPLVDWINVMTYDMAGGWSRVTGFHAPLYPSAQPPPEGTSTDTALRRFLDAGVPADQLVVGVPFYGRGFAGVGPAHDGLHQPFDGVPPGTWEPGAFDYGDLVAHYIGQPGCVRHWSDAAQVPWLFNPETGIWITYDDPESLARKAEYVRDRGFGGMMFWELSADDDAAALLTTISTALNGAR